MSQDLGPLPEPPAFYRYQFQSHYGPVWRSSAENWNDCPPLASEGLYTADQMHAYAAEQVAAERKRCAAAVRAVPTHTWVDGSDQFGNPCPAKIVTTREQYAQACERA